MKKEEAQNQASQCELGNRQEPNGAKEEGDGQKKKRPLESLTEKWGRRERGQPRWGRGNERVGRLERETEEEGDPIDGPWIDRGMEGGRRGLGGGSLVSSLCLVSR